MARDDSTFDISRPAGGKVDEESYGLSLIERLFRRDSGSDKKYQTEEEE
jgi:hypothetical protein